MLINTVYPNLLHRSGTAQHFCDGGGGAKKNAEGIFSARRRRKRPRGVREHAPPENFLNKCL